jgi:hypothetical protein
MMTVKQIERLWNAREPKGRDRLRRELVAARPEAGAVEVEPLADVFQSAGVAALAMVRLDELSQSHVPLFGQLLRTILAAQEADGGWGEPVVTALCIRALLCDGGDGLAVERGLVYLVNLQKDDGSWPREPLRRMPADGLTTALVLLHLVDSAAFRRTVRFADAVAWFEHNADQLDEPVRRLWSLVALRSRLYRDLEPTPQRAA